MLLITFITIIHTLWCHFLLGKCHLWLFNEDSMYNVRKSESFRNKQPHVGLFQGGSLVLCAGFLDWVPKKMQRVGCMELLNTVQRRVQPKLHVFGHIHEGTWTRTWASVPQTSGLQRFPPAVLLCSNNLDQNEFRDDFNPTEHETSEPPIESNVCDGQQIQQWQEFHRLSESGSTEVFFVFLRSNGGNRSLNQWSSHVSVF